MTGGNSSRSGLRTVFICQALDREDPVLPTTVRWVEALAGKGTVEHVSVLALRTGRYQLPANVEVERFGRSNRLATTAAFYRALAGATRRRPDFFFVYQGGPYPALLLPLKVLRGIPIVQWKAHPVINRKMSFYARRCDDLILTSAAAAFPMDLAKVKVIGQGVDTERFQIEERPPLGDLIAVGRISPTKRVVEMIEAVVQSNRSHGTGYTFNVYGPTLPADERYAADIEQLIDQLEAREYVTLNGPVSQEQLPSLLNAHRACLNFSTGALDKTAVEAMACGLPVVSTNDAVIEVMPPDLHRTLVPDKLDGEDQARAIHELLCRPEEEIARLGERLRSLVVSEHSIERLFDRILEEVEALLCGRG
jgi:glycosyltransferase involved in cell wall biosynthesis